MLDYRETQMGGYLQASRCQRRQDVPHGRKRARLLSDEEAAPTPGLLPPNHWLSTSANVVSGVSSLFKSICPWLENPYNMAYIPIPPPHIIISSLARGMPRCERPKGDSSSEEAGTSPLGESKVTNKNKAGSAINGFSISALTS